MVVYDIELTMGLSLGRRSREVGAAAAHGLLRMGFDGLLDIKQSWYQSGGQQGSNTSQSSRPRPYDPRFFPK